MRPVLLSQLALWCEGRLIGDDVLIARISTDSRDALQHGLFVALKGERFDAHDFVAQAKANGAWTGENRQFAHAGYRPDRININVRLARGKGIKRHDDGYQAKGFQLPGQLL